MIRRTFVVPRGDNLYISPFPTPEPGAYVLCNHATWKVLHSEVVSERDMVVYLEAVNPARLPVDERVRELPRPINELYSATKEMNVRSSS